MHTTNQLLDEIAKRHRDASDYRIAKLLNTAQQTVSNWRRGKNVMSPDFGTRVAVLLGWDAAYIMASLEHERVEKARADGRDPLEQTGEILSTWARIAEKFRPTLPSVLLAMLALFGLMLLPHHVEASQIFGPRSSSVASVELRHNVYSVKSLLRRLRSWLAANLSFPLQMNFCPA